MPDRRMAVECRHIRAAILEPPSRASQQSATYHRFLKSARASFIDLLSPPAYDGHP
jgi:hypothetical protein